MSMQEAAVAYKISVAGKVWAYAYSAHEIEWYVGELNRRLGHPLESIHISLEPANLTEAATK